MCRKVEDVWEIFKEWEYILLKVKGDNFVLSEKDFWDKTWMQRKVVEGLCREIIQEPNENPAMFLNQLTEALTQYTCLDLASPAGATVLATLFLSQPPTFGKN